MFWYCAYEWATVALYTVQYTQRIASAVVHLPLLDCVTLCLQLGHLPLKVALLSVKRLELQSPRTRWYGLTRIYINTY
jgi:hypothetical protein